MTDYYGLGHGRPGATFGRGGGAFDTALQGSLYEHRARAEFARAIDAFDSLRARQQANQQWAFMTKKGFQLSRQSLRYGTSLGWTFAMPWLTDKAGQAVLGQFWSIVNGPGPGWVMTTYCRGGGVLVGTGGGDCTPNHLMTQNQWDAALGKLVGGDQAWYNIETYRNPAPGAWQMNYDVGERWRYDGVGDPDPTVVPKSLPLSVVLPSPRTDTDNLAKPKKKGEKARVFFPLGDSSWRSYTGLETATNFNREPPGDDRGNRIKSPWPRKPKPREREVKKRVGGKLGHAVRVLVGGGAGLITESMDAINAVWKAVDAKSRRAAFVANGYEPLPVWEKFAWMVTHPGAIDYDEAVRHLINNQIEDFVYGMLGQLDQKAARSRGAGSTTMYRIEKSLRDMGIEGFSSGEDDPRKKLIEFLQIGK